MAKKPAKPKPGKGYPKPMKGGKPCLEGDSGLG